MAALKVVDTNNIPGAWYDLTVRIEAAKSVMSCALESLPGNLQGMDHDRINHTGNLIAATQDLLALISADADLIATQLKL